MIESWEVVINEWSWFVSASSRTFMAASVAGVDAGSWCGTTVCVLEWCEAEDDVEAVGEYEASEGRFESCSCSTCCAAVERVDICLDTTASIDDPIEANAA